VRSLILIVLSSDPLTGIGKVGAGHTQVFLSPSLLEIKLASLPETSVITDAGVDYYSVRHPQGHLLPHSSLAELAML